MEPSEQDFWDHLEELRHVLIRCLAIVLVGFFLAAWKYDSLFRWLSPVSSNTQLVILSPTEGLSTLIKLSFWASLVGTAPLWLFLVFRFIAPALKGRERLLLLPFALVSLCFLYVGLSFGKGVTLPLANSVLFEFNSHLGQNLWSVQQYFQYSVILLLGNALAFEMAVVLIFLVHFGRVGPEGLRRHRRHAIIAIFFLSAVLTPPDVFTQCLLAIPLCGFYEISILYACWRRRKLSALECTPSPGRPDHAT